MSLGGEGLKNVPARQIGMNGYLLECATDPAGGFESLWFVPKGETGVHGLVTSTHGRLESKDEIGRRIECGRDLHAKLAKCLYDISPLGQGAGLHEVRLRSMNACKIVPSAMVTGRCLLDYVVPRHTTRRVFTCLHHHAQRSPFARCRRVHGERFH
jgi:hypothetical protein